MSRGKEMPQEVREAIEFAEWRSRVNDTLERAAQEEWRRQAEARLLTLKTKKETRGGAGHLRIVRARA